MSIFKILLLVLVVGILLFALLLFYTLSPTIRNVSHKRQLKVFLNKPLKLERKAVIYLMEQGQYRFSPHLLSENLMHPWQKQQELAAGSRLIIHAFKTYKNAVSGFTHLYALGEVTTAGCQQVTFEYDWASLAPSTVLPLALWQHDHEALIGFESR